MRSFFKSLPVETVSVSCIASQTTDPTPQYAASPVAVHTLPVHMDGGPRRACRASAGVSPAASLLRASPLVTPPSGSPSVCALRGWDQQGREEK